MSLAEPAATVRRIIREKEVCRRTGYGRSSLRAMSSPKKCEPQLFPSAIKLGEGPRGAVGWLESDVDAWIAAKARGETKDEIAALVAKLEQQRTVAA